MVRRNRSNSLGLVVAGPRPESIRPTVSCALLPDRIRSPVRLVLVVQEPISPHAPCNVCARKLPRVRQSVSTSSVTCSMQS